MLSLLILILLVILLVGLLPVYPYSRSWGIAPGGIIGLLLIIVLIWFLFSRVG